MANRKVEKFDTLEAFRSTYNETSEDVGDISGLHDTFEGVPKDIIEALGNKANREELNALAGPLVIMGTFGDTSGDLPPAGQLGQAYFCESDNYWSTSGQFLANRPDMAIWTSGNIWRLIKKGDSDFAHKHMDEIISGAWTFLEEIRSLGFIGDGSGLTGIVGGSILPNQIRPTHFNVPGTFRGRGVYKLINSGDPTGKEGVYVLRDDGSPELPGEEVFEEKDYVLALTAGEIEEINDLADVWSQNRVVGSTLAWDGLNYVSADFPEEGRQGPEGAEGPQGPIGREPFGVPVGGIIMWAGQINMIPTNYVLCDGTMGTPDLRDKFIIGAGVKDVREEGGGTSGSTELSGSQMPSHTHDWSGQSTTAGNGAHDHLNDTDGLHDHTASSAGSHSHVALSEGSHTHGTYSSGTSGGGGYHNHNIHEGREVTTGTSVWNANSGTAGISVTTLHSGWKDAPHHTHEISVYGTSELRGSHTHTTSNSINHDHVIDSEGSHTHTMSQADDHSHSVIMSGTTTAQGSGMGHTHTVVPKYFTLAYIMRLGGQPFDVANAPVEVRKGG